MQGHNFCFSSNLVHRTNNCFSLLVVHPRHLCWHFFDTSLLVLTIPNR